MKKEDKADFIIGLFGLTLLVGGFFLKLHVMTRLWAMILVPMGAPAIDKWQAYGIVLIAALALSNISHIVSTKQEKDGKASEKWLRYGVASVLAPLLTWGIASLIF